MAKSVPSGPGPGQGLSAPGTVPQRMPPCATRPPPVACASASSTAAPPRSSTPSENSR